MDNAVLSHFSRLHDATLAANVTHDTLFPILFILQMFLIARIRYSYPNSARKPTRLQRVTVVWSETSIIQQTNVEIFLFFSFVSFIIDPWSPYRLCTSERLIFSSYFNILLVSIICAYLTQNFEKYAILQCFFTMFLQRCNYYYMKKYVCRICRYALSSFTISY